MRFQRKILGAFTLVELIVVITIVGILSTVGFVSYSGYLSGARDSNRMSQLTKISDSLQVYAATKSLPLPDDFINITASGSSNIIAYQGYVGVDVLETIDYTNGGTDPKDDTYYTYYLTKDRKNIQLLAFMEESIAFISPFNLQNTYAADYEDRIPRTYGKKLGVLVSAEPGTINTPAQEISTNTVAGYLDIVTETSNYAALFNDDAGIIGTGSVLSALEFSDVKSCKDILEKKPSSQSGIYTLIRDWEEVFNVQCDMDIDGGGWTLIASYADGVFFNDCTDVGMSYGTNCTASCDEIVGGNCTTVSDMELQDAELEKLQKKYVVIGKQGDLSTYTSTDYVSPAYYDVGFTQSLFKDNNNEYISYVFGENKSMSDFYRYSNTQHLELIIPAYKSNIPTSINRCDNFDLAIMAADNDGGNIDYDSRKYIEYSPAHSGPGWDSQGNGSCGFDDSGGRWGLKRLGGQDNETSPYIAWYVR